MAHRKLSEPNSGLGLGLVGEASHEGESCAKNEVDKSKMQKDLPEISLFGDLLVVLTILISTEFEAIVLPICERRCFESEIAHCPQLNEPNSPSCYYDNSFRKIGSNRL